MRTDSTLQNHEWITSWSDREHLRLLSIVELIQPLISDEPIISIDELLNFDRLEQHVRHHADVLPACVSWQQMDASAAGWRRANDRVQVSRFTSSVWSMAGSGVAFQVDVVDVPLDTGLNTVVRCLEDMYYGDLTPNSGNGEALRLWPERHASPRTHQFVIYPDAADEPSPDDLQRLIYRADLEARLEYTRIWRPDELNRRPKRGAACGPFVTVLWGQQDYIENLAFMSAFMAVNAASVIRDTRITLVHQLKFLDSFLMWEGRDGAPARSVSETRAALSEANRALTRGENRIAMSVDAMSTLLPYVPGLRSESYHRALFETLDFAGNRDSLERMLARAKELVRVENDLLQTRVARQSDQRRMRWTVSLGAVSLLTIPVGVVFGFFGVASSEIDPTLSMFDSRYWPIYAFTAMTALGVLGAHLVMYFVHNRRKAMD